MYDLILKDFGLEDKDVLLVFPYGSRVYGTHSEKSDHDFIIVVNDDSHDRDSLESSYHNFNATIYSKNSFREKLIEHKISALECYFLPKEKLLKSGFCYPFRVYPKMLRESISEKASHSWVKAKKKFEVVQDRNVYTAKKSLFHSLRIIDFGIQIAKEGRIVNYGSSNDIWEDVITNPSEDWEDYKKQYQELYNSRMTEFRKLAPK